MLAVKIPPKISFQNFRKYLFILIVAIGLFSFGYVSGSGKYSGGKYYPDVKLTREIPSGKEELDFTLFWRVWDILQDRYFDKDKLIPAKMVYGAIEGMVSAVGDPYTVYLPPEKNKIVQEDLKGSFGGVGIQIGFRGTQLAVIAPLPDTPAESSGIRAGDLIIGIKDDEKEVDRGTVGISVQEAVQLIRGPEGTVVTLTLLREEEEKPLAVDVVRGIIDVPSLTLSFVEGTNGKFAHVKLLKFSGETFDEWNEAVFDILKTQGLDGVILDVRNNPGGFLQAAVDIASEFLENGKVVVIEEAVGGSRDEIKVDRLGKLKNVDVVVLINEGSASASEILAGALRDVEGVVLVGQTTFGKGTIQEPQQLTNGVAEQSGLHITIARWLTPDGIWVDQAGLVPDFEVEDDPETEEDEQLQKAIEILSN